MGVNTLTVTVVDIELMPVEGATVVIAEPGHFEVSAVGVSTPENRERVTDVDGQAEFRLAASVDYLLPVSYQYACTLTAPGQDQAYSINFTMPDRDADLHAIVDLPAQPPASTAVPPGGMRGQVLTKLSDRSYDVGWATVSGGGPPIPPPLTGLLFGTSADEVPVASELTIAGMNGMGTFAAWAGERHMLIAGLASEPDITSVTFSDDQSGTNQLGVFSKFGSAVRVAGADYSVWVSMQALMQPTDVVVTVT